MVPRHRKKLAEEKKELYNGRKLGIAIELKEGDYERFYYHYG